MIPLDTEVPTIFADAMAKLKYMDGNWWPLREAADMILLCKAINSDVISCTRTEWLEGHLCAE